MLATLGSVIFEIAPVNLHGVDRDATGAYVEKPILGKRPPLEFVGDGPETYSLSVKLFPERLGGFASLADIEAMRASGMAQYFMRGDGVPQGWHVVEKVREKHTYLGSNGVGRVIEVDIGLKRADAPGASDLFSVIEGLL